MINSADQAKFVNGVEGAVANQIAIFKVVVIGVLGPAGTGFAIRVAPVKDRVNLPGFQFE